MTSSFYYNYLNTNFAKSSALCLNKADEVQEELQQIQIEVQNHIKHLGIYQGETIQSTLNETIRTTEAKLIKQRILATSPPTDMLHRSILVNMAFIPLFNHIFMALPVHDTILDELNMEVQNSEKEKKIIS